VAGGHKRYRHKPATAALKRAPLPILATPATPRANWPQAREAWQQALTILEDLQRPDAGQVRSKLASTNGHGSPSPSA
jgi:hypothetical protein